MTDETEWMMLLEIRGLRDQLMQLNEVLTDELGGITDQLQALASWRRAVQLEVIRAYLSDFEMLNSLMHHDAGSDTQVLRNYIDKTTDALVEEPHRGPDARKQVGDGQ